MRKRIQVLLVTLMLVAGLSLMSKAAYAQQEIEGGGQCPTIGCECCSNNYTFFCLGSCTEAGNPGTCLLGVRSCSCGWHCESSICVPPGYCGS